MLRDVVDYHSALRKTKTRAEEIADAITRDGFGEEIEKRKATGIVTEVGPVVAEACSISSIPTAAENSASHQADRYQTEERNDFDEGRGQIAVRGNNLGPHRHVASR